MDLSPIKIMNEDYKNNIQLDKKVYIRYKQLQELIRAIDEGQREQIADKIIETFNTVVKGIREAFQYDLEFLSAITNIESYKIPETWSQKNQLIEQIRIDIRMLLGTTRAFIDLHITQGKWRSMENVPPGAENLG